MRYWKRWIVISVGVLAIGGWGTGGEAGQTTPTTNPAQDLLTLPEEKPIRGMGWPSLSPDGKTLCFTYLGDLWTVSATGGTATRLTVHESLDAYSRWSPDGKWLAFTSLRNGNADLFLIPATGGEARQVTFHSAEDLLNDWSPDGTRLLFYSRRDARNWTLYSIDLRTRALKQLTRDVEPVRFGAWSPDGKTVAYSRAGQPWWRPWYQGSVAARVTLTDLTNGKVRTPLKTDGQQFWPLFAPDGQSLFVTTLYGKSGKTPNLWRVPLDGSEPKPVTAYTADAVRFPAIARNGSRLTYLWNGDLYTVRPDGTEAQKVRILAASDDKVNNQERQTLTQEATEMELSPDGKTLALVLRGEVWTLPTSGGEARRLTDDPANDSDISWSPDSAKLAVVSDRGNQPDIYLLDVKTKQLTRLTNDTDAKSRPAFSPDGKTVAYAKAGAEPGLYLVTTLGGRPIRLAEGNGNNSFGLGISSFAWSPDGRWIAFSRMDRYQNRDIWVVPSVGGNAINITRYPGFNMDPRFTKDGRRLLFASDRNNGIPLVYQVPLETDDEPPAIEEEGKPRARPDRSRDVKIDFDDIHLRARPVTPPIGGVQEYALAADNTLVVFRMSNNFWLVPVAGGPVLPLTSGGEIGFGIQFAPDDSRFFYLDPRGAPRFLPFVGPPFSDFTFTFRDQDGARRTFYYAGKPPITIGFTAHYVYDRRATYRQAFHEFMRRYGAGFYDPKLHGVDWKSLRAKYEPILQGVGTPEEFANLLSMLVGEVNASHSEIGPPTRSGGPQTATLGLAYDDSYTGPGVKVAGVLPKGPADKPASRIQPGEYILSVDGAEMALTEAFALALQDKAGKTLELLVNSKPTKDGARTVRIRPITAAAWTNLEYEARVRKTRERVEQISNNRLAYAHLRVFDEPSLQRLLRELWSEAMDKDGLILDLRGNGGGSPVVNDTILDTLSRRAYGFTQPRDGQRQTAPERAWTKPVVLLIDQNSMSAGEMFPAAFRTLKLGKIVGVPTPGYLIGTYEARLVEGTQFRLPTWGYFTPEGKNLENLGVAPDIVVENTPEDIAAGRDRQLEVAVETALSQTASRADTSARL